MTYKTGEDMTLTITGIKPYGAFGVDENDVTGLIHVSNIQESGFCHPAEYFKLGDVVTGKVVRHEPKGKMGVSTKHLNLVPLSKRKEKEKEKKSQIIPFTSSVIRDENIDMTEIKYDEIYDHMEKIIKQPLSEEAKENVKTNIETHGLFQFTLALSRQGYFNPDLGLLLSRTIDEDIRGRL